MSPIGTALSLTLAFALFVAGFAVGLVQKAMLFCLLFAGLAAWLLPGLVTAWKATA